MIDELGDPLVHLVRNSVDHGIESPEVREAAGKPREGTVSLDAYHRGSSIVIEVHDDGKGLDADRILRKCLENGLVTRADADKMTTQQIYQKIWEPGLSTAEKVTEVSGRGMGMDIVKSKIEELSGSVDINSVPGQGTTITIKLPLTLAILPSLMVEIRGEVFAIPMEAVVEIVSVTRHEVNSVQGRQMACVRGRMISLLRLGELLSFHGDDAPRRARLRPRNDAGNRGRVGQGNRPGRRPRHRRRGHGHQVHRRKLRQCRGHRRGQHPRRRARVADPRYRRPRRDRFPSKTARLVRLTLMAKGTIHAGNH